MTVGNFRIIERIGAGGMGVVYRAEDIKLGRAVALKFLSSDVKRRDELTERFIREAQAASSLDHPNIGTIFSIGDDDENGMYIAMALYEGETLRQRIARGALPVPEALDIFMQITRGLREAHEAGIIHRDIKPANVMVTPRGLVKLLDFGLAKLAKHATMTRTGALLGTITYMAPEALENRRSDARADLWALGVMAYEMLAGVTPFKKEHAGAIMMAILKSDPRPLHEVRPEVPYGLSRVVSTLLEKKLEERYASAAALLRDLDNLSGLSMVFMPELAPLKPQRHNLPKASTPFVGREQELATIEERLESGQCRLLTLAGSGGMGKTRLAMQTGWDALDGFSDGVYFVPLAPLTSPDLILPALMSALGLISVGKQDPLAQLKDYLREKRILLIFDNFEHLTDGAELLMEMLEDSHHLKLLVTSRERLNLPDECVLEISGLHYPHSSVRTESGRSYAALELFLNSARKQKPQYSLEMELEAAIRLCDLVEGSPLGLELAASWLRLMPVSEIVMEIEKSMDFLNSNLRGIPERHRSMRAVFDYSWGLLSERERQTLAKLSVFRGGFKREAAETVAGANLALLMSLVDKSLLQRHSSRRFSMQEMFRAYAAEKLTSETARQEAQRCHLTHYLEVAQEAQETLKGEAQLVALEELEAEHDNLRAALDWSIEHVPEWALELSVALRPYWIMRGYLQEGQQRLAAALERAQAPSEALRARALSALGDLYQRLGDYDAAVTRLEAGLTLARNVGDTATSAHALSGLSWIASRRSQRESARQLGEEALLLTQALDDPALTAYTQRVLGVVALDERDYERAEQLYRESLERYDRLGDRSGVSQVLNNLGMVASSRGDLVQAARYHEEGLAIAQEVGNRESVVLNALNFGNVALAQEEGAAAGQYYGKALKEALAIGALPLALHALRGIAGVRAQAGDYTAAAESLGLVLHHPSSNADVQNYAQGTLDLLRERLGEGLTGALERGRALDLNTFLVEWSSSV